VLLLLVVPVVLMSTGATVVYVAMAVMPQVLRPVRRWMKPLRPHRGPLENRQEEREGGRGKGALLVGKGQQAGGEGRKDAAPVPLVFDDPVPLVRVHTDHLPHHTQHTPHTTTQ